MKIDYKYFKISCDLIKKNQYGIIAYKNETLKMRDNIFNFIIYIEILKRRYQSTNRANDFSIQIFVSIKMFEL